MNRAMIIAAAALLACGSSGNAALSKTFSYGAPQTPDSTQQAAANSAQGTLADTSTFSASPDPSRGTEVIGFADSLSLLALGAPSFGVAAEGVRGELRAGDASACATLSGATVTFSNCTQDVQGFSVVYSGSITAGAGKVSWSTSGTSLGTESSVSFDIAHHQSGSLQVTASKITGNALADYGGTLSGQGASESFAFGTALVMDLTYQTAPTPCVTGGSLEVKRVWTQKPNGASGAGYADAGLKLTWTGCNAVQAAHSM